MTKFDIRLRRKQFTQSRIESYKNYQSLLDQHQEYDKKRTRGIMVVVALIIVIMAILMVIFHEPAVDQKKKNNPDEPVNKTEQSHQVEQGSNLKSNNIFSL